VAEQGGLITVRLARHSADDEASLSLTKSRAGTNCTLLFLVAAACFGLLPLAEAQTTKAEEYQVKAAYLYNFGKFISWPPGANSGDRFLICVLGHDPFGESLDRTIAGDSIGNKKLAAKRVSSFRDAADCRILFISESEAANRKEILAYLHKLPIVTVSDIAAFAAHGGMIEFVLKDNRVRFEVNLQAAQEAGLTFSSQLLKVAVAVRNEH
jgi:hypothetical protein